MPDTDLVRDMARSGVLAERAGTATGPEYTRLKRGAYDIVWPVVFQRLTRGFEIRRGHPVCAASVTGLRPDCLDKFQDDVEASLEDLLRNAKVPIQNLDGWISTRLNAATVDAHRRRRGERGALQRPRLPGWLATKLSHDPWLAALAIEILVWVGVPTAAGAGLWPLGAWAELRSRATGNLHGGEAEAAADVEIVLAAMRQNHGWYEDYVERPLGRKQAPVLPAQRSYSDQHSELSQLALTDRHETDDVHLAELASTAVAAIEQRLRCGDDPRTAVAFVLRTVFGGGTGAEEMDRVPGSGGGNAERAAAMLADPATIARITDTALEILGVMTPVTPA